MLSSSRNKVNGKTEQTIPAATVPQWKRVHLLQRVG